MPQQTIGRVLSEAANLLGYSAVSRRAGVFKAKLQENKELQRKFGRLKSIIVTTQVDRPKAED
jgi:hypothetical protein